ncbi:MAG: carbonic anhydrase [Actinomycetota bacterium]|nr:carbonic anhydrase [Actinomycetota bacterium]
MSVDDLMSGRPNPVPIDPSLGHLPARKLAIVTCMDVRIPPLDSFGLRLGDAHVIRNAGAAVTDDVVRSVAISQHKLGSRVVFLMAHTGCGMATFTDDDFVAELSQGAGQQPTWRPRTFTDPVEHVRAGLVALRSSAFLHPDTEARGFVIDLRSGAVDEIR